MELIVGRFTNGANENYENITLNLAGFHALKRKSHKLQQC